MLWGTPEIHPLSLHDALPICARRSSYRMALQVLLPITWNQSGERGIDAALAFARCYSRSRSGGCHEPRVGDRKSTRLNSSHPSISYALFRLKTKRKIETVRTK